MWIIFVKECFEAVNKSKEQYLKTMGLKLADSQSSPITYWTTLKKLLNKTHTKNTPYPQKQQTCHRLQRKS